eukprot:517767_1
MEDNGRDLEMFACRMMVRTRIKSNFHETQMMNPHLHWLLTKQMRTPHAQQYAQYASHATMRIIRSAQILMMNGNVIEIGFTIQAAHSIHSNPTKRDQIHGSVHQITE